MRALLCLALTLGQLQSAQGDGGGGEVLIDVVARCWVQSLTELCVERIGAEPETEDQVRRFSECCEASCHGTRMFGKRRVYTPAWMDEWWRSESRECLCCPTLTAAAPTASRAPLIMSTLLLLHQL